MKWKTRKLSKRDVYMSREEHHRYFRGLRKKETLEDTPPKPADPPDPVDYSFLSSAKIQFGIQCQQERITPVGAILS